MQKMARASHLDEERAPIDLEVVDSVEAVLRRVSRTAKNSMLQVNHKYQSLDK
jgi:hypothetical protein